MLICHICRECVIKSHLARRKTGRKELASWLLGIQIFRWGLLGSSRVEGETLF